MSIGASGRIVIEIDPVLKRQLYAKLLTPGMSLKDWFVINANNFVNQGENQKAREKTAIAKRKNEK